ncbi:hypothetical protein FRC02_006800 [Tulasnella sp. 418]|nr:hypothetical protein FRC02_006800 [Tulasnella sp. 418]
MSHRQSFFMSIHPQQNSTGEESAFTNNVDTSARSDTSTTSTLVASRTETSPSINQEDPTNRNSVDSSSEKRASKPGPLNISSLKRKSGKNNATSNKQHPSRTHEFPTPTAFTEPRGIFHRDHRSPDQATDLNTRTSTRSFFASSNTAPTSPAPFLPSSRRFPSASAHAEDQFHDAESRPTAGILTPISTRQVARQLIPESAPRRRTSRNEAAGIYPEGLLTGIHRQADRQYAQQTEVNSRGNTVQTRIALDDETSSNHTHQNAVPENRSRADIESEEIDEIELEERIDGLKRAKLEYVEVDLSSHQNRTPTPNTSSSFSRENPEAYLMTLQQQRLSTTRQLPPVNPSHNWSSLLNDIPAEFQEYVSRHERKIEMLRSKWKDCTLEEWYEGGKELTQKFDKIVCHVQDGMKTKMKLYADIQKRLVEQTAILDTRDVQLKTARDELLQKAGKVVA